MYRVFYRQAPSEPPRAPRWLALRFGSDTRTNRPLVFVPYLHEKREALARLAALIERIINPPADNVASLDKQRAEGQHARPSRSISQSRPDLRSALRLDCQNRDA